MINLTQSAAASPLVHTVPCDPGTSWATQTIAIDAPPDDDLDPAPNAQWERDALRTGLCGAVGPRVVALPTGGYRMYYTQILPRAGFPTGANDYDNATSRILSATSADGLAWIPDPGVRLSPQQGGAGDFRVVSSEVVPVDGSGKLRMYYECCAGPQSQQNSIRSAVSDDGFVWTVEPGTRLELSQRNVSSPRIVFLDSGRCRLYCGQRGQGIISSVSDDGGLTFELEPGIRVAADQTFDRLTAFAPEIMRLNGGGYRMFYAGYSNPTRADVLTALSEDGLHWQKAPQPVLSPSSDWDAAKCSEMCVIWNPQSQGADEGFRMLYEACDGTALNQRGVWRIAAAICVC
jgi:predicted GH43/DUF377 family glycosyl hydrolase